MQKQHLAFSRMKKRFVHLQKTWLIRWCKTVNTINSYQNRLQCCCCLYNVVAVSIMLLLSMCALIICIVLCVNPRKSSCCSSWRGSKWTSLLDWGIYNNLTWTHLFHSGLIVTHSTSFSLSYSSASAWHEERTTCVFPIPIKWHKIVQAQDSEITLYISHWNNNLQSTHR